MDKTETLKACPFCGGAMMFRKALWPSDGCTDAVIHAEPTDCGMAAFDTSKTDESVITTWNTRTPRRDNALADELEREAQIARDNGMHRWERLLGKAATALRSTASATDDEVWAHLELARDLICEAKGADGPNGGFVTNHLDAAEGHLDAVEKALGGSNG